MSPLSPASARLALAVFHRAYMDATSDLDGSVGVHRRHEAVCWLREFGYVFLLIAGVGDLDARRMMEWVLSDVAPFSNTGLQNAVLYTEVLDER